jgi:hypothetical protein
MKKFRHYLHLALRLHDTRDLTEAEVVNDITDYVRNKCVFNWWSFYIGALVGLFIMDLITRIFK